MKAAVYHEFQGPVDVTDLADPRPDDTGAVLEVRATGVCRSDWHGWMGHDRDISLPHVPGHEISGVVAAVGKGVKNWRPGDRVTVPFVCGCGHCAQCESGNEQVCDNQSQPGFTHWGSYAQYVAIRHADVNLVRLPEALDFVTAASLGCRFATSFRGIVAQGRVRPDEWVAVHGCGGVGLSAVMIAIAHGAQVIAVDISAAALEVARALGAHAGIQAQRGTDVVAEIREISDGGVHVSMDALGSTETCINSIACLRKRGRHVQVGLLAGDSYRPAIPMELVIANELEVIGSHGMQAHCYADMLGLIMNGRMNPATLVGQTLDLRQAASALGNPEPLRVAGISVIDRFDV